MYYLHRLAHEVIICEYSFKPNESFRQRKVCKPISFEVTARLPAGELLHFREVQTDGNFIQHYRGEEYSFGHISKRNSSSGVFKGHEVAFHLPFTHILAVNPLLNAHPSHLVVHFDPFISVLEYRKMNIYTGLRIEWRMRLFVFCPRPRLHSCSASLNASRKPVKVVVSSRLHLPLAYFVVLLHFIKWTLITDWGVLAANECFNEQFLWRKSECHYARRCYDERERNIACSIDFSPASCVTVKRKDWLYEFLPCFVQ